MKAKLYHYLFKFAKNNNLTSNVSWGIKCQTNLHFLLARKTYDDELND